MDLTGRVARLLDVVEGPNGEALCDWVSGRVQPWRDAIGVAALDPFRRYASALSTSVPAAIRVLDAFHVSRLGFAAVDDVRRRVQQESTGHRGRKHDPLFRFRRLLRRRADRLSEPAWQRLLIGLELGDVNQQIAPTLIAAQDLCRLYQWPGYIDLGVREKNTKHEDETPEARAERLKEDWVRTKGAHEAVIDEATWAAPRPSERNSPTGSTRLPSGSTPSLRTPIFLTGWSAASTARARPKRSTSYSSGCSGGSSFRKRRSPSSPGAARLESTTGPRGAGPRIVATMTATEPLVAPHTAAHDNLLGLPKPTTPPRPEPPPLTPIRLCGCGCGQPIRRHAPSDRWGHNSPSPPLVPPETFDNVNVVKPRPGERCILCAEPADKVVLGRTERGSESGLRRRTPVCAPCANAAGRPRIDGSARAVG